MSFARAFAALTGASVVSMAAQVARGKLAALLLGPAGVGVFNQLTLAWNLANVAGGLGTFNGIVQHGAEAIASEDRGALRRLTSTFTLLLGGVSLGIALIGTLFANQLSDWLLHDDGAHGSLVALLMLGIPVGVTAQSWRALLSAARAVPRLVRSQIASDVGGAAIFVGLVIWLGLRGAILGFMASHLILFLVQAAYIRRELGPGLLRPRLSDFSWRVVRSNVGFGLSGLLLIALSNLGVLLVARMLIDRLGPEANGYFANAWRIASVYLGAVTTTTIGYFLPTLAAAKDDRAMASEVNATLRFYLAILPPIMAAIMAAGGLIVWLILSKAFMPVAALLLIFVPAELLRILADTMLAQFLARRRLWPFTLTYLLQFGLFCGLSALLIPIWGIAGAAAGYGGAMAASIVAALMAARASFSFLLDRATILALLRGGLLLVGVGCGAHAIVEGPVRYGTAIILIGIWFAIAMRDAEFLLLLRGAMTRIGFRAAAQ